MTINRVKLLEQTCHCSPSLSSYPEVNLLAAIFPASSALKNGFNFQLSSLARPSLSYAVGTIFTAPTSFGTSKRNPISIFPSQFHTLLESFPVPNPCACNTVDSGYNFSIHIPPEFTRLIILRTRQKLSD